MKERKLDFEINNNPAQVEDPDGKLLAELENLYSEVQTHLGTCYNLLKKKQLTEGLKDSILTLVDSNVTKFLSKLGYDGVLTERNEKYARQIRSLHDENHALRRQLGEKVSNEDVRERLKIMKDSFNAWWLEFGFGHCPEFSFGGYKATAVLSGMVFGSRDPRISEKSKEEYLKQLGFEIDDQRIVYSDKSMALLTKLLADKYSSAEIYNMTLSISARRGATVIESATVYIGDLNDLTEPNKAQEPCQ